MELYWRWARVRFSIIKSHWFSLWPKLCFDPQQKKNFFKHWRISNEHNRCRNKKKLKRWRRKGLETGINYHTTDIFCFSVSHPDLLSVHLFSNMSLSAPFVLSCWTSNQQLRWESDEIFIGRASSMMVGSKRTISESRP